MWPVEVAPQDDDQLDLQAYLVVLRRRWKAIAAVALLAVVAALAFSLGRESQYRAESEVLIRQDTTSLINGTPVVDASDAARALNNEVRLFESGTVLAAVNEAYSGPLEPDEVKASVSSDTSDVIEASLVAADPDEAAELLDLYVTTFIEVRRTQRTNELLAVGTEIQAKIDELNIQIATVRQPLTDLERRLAADPDNTALAEQRDQVADELAERLTPRESQRDFYQSQIDDLELTADIAQSGGAQILTPAESSDAPVSPRPMRDAAIALVLGLALGVGVAFLVDTLDERIRGVADLEQVTMGLPTLALVPEVEKGHGAHFVATRDDAQSPQAEAFRSLRTAVKFSAVAHPIKVIQITSPSQGEGKTTAVSNLAVALAQGGDRVAVVCCDLRRPLLHDRFDVSLTPGLTDVLLGDSPLADALQGADDDVLVLPAGTLAHNPSELLSSPKAAAVIRALAEEFDVVLVDSTPVLPVTDALVTSHFVDATIVMADCRSTHRKALRRTLQLLSQVNAPVLGVVLNGLPEASSPYGAAYGYSFEAAPPRRGRMRRGEPV